MRKDNVLRVARDLCRLLPISRIVYEEGQFDTRRVWDEDVADYQIGPNSEFENRKKAVLWRDRYTCQYCGQKGGELTVDHVLPKSRGGKSTWDNLVAACRSCNLRKGDRTPEEAGMRLLRPPKPPRVPLFLLDLKEVPPDWRPFVEGLLG